MTLASSLHKNKMTRAMSWGFGHFEKSAFGIALRLASVSMMLGRMVFTRTPLPFTSAARASSIATAAEIEEAQTDAPESRPQLVCGRLLEIKKKKASAIPPDTPPMPESIARAWDVVGVL